MPAFELTAYSVDGFCLAHGLSRSKLYDMLRAGDGPRVMKCGTRTLISVEAAQAWRRGRRALGCGVQGARRPKGPKPAPDRCSSRLAA
jgi:hypothetical protein